MGQFKNCLGRTSSNTNWQFICSSLESKPAHKMNKKYAHLLVALIGLYLLSAAPKTSAVPVKFMCDMCESNFLHCLMKCHMEEYMTRHNYENHVYVGTPHRAPKKNHLDMMFEHIMHQTGHDHM